MAKSVPDKTHDLKDREFDLYERMAAHKQRIAEIEDKAEREAELDKVLEFGKETACRFVRNAEHNDGTPQYVDLPANLYRELAATTFEFEKMKWRCDEDKMGYSYVRLKTDLTLSPRKLINAIRAVRLRHETQTLEAVKEVIRSLRGDKGDTGDMLCVSNWLNYYGDEIERTDHGGLPRLHKTLHLSTETEQEDAERQARYAAYLESEKVGCPGSQLRAEAIRDDGRLPGTLENGTPVVLQYLTGHPLCNPETGEVEKRTPYAVLHPDDVPWIDAVLADLVGEGSPFRWTLMNDRTVKIQSDRTISVADEIWKLHHRKEIPPGHVISARDGEPLNLWPSNLDLEGRSSGRRHAAE
jgi:hypothetical protein